MMLDKQDTLRMVLNGTLRRVSSKSYFREEPCGA